MMRAILAILLLTLICLPSTTADTYCSASVPCAIGCCGHNNVCGLGPDYCAPENCINNCNAKSECNPGNWPEQYTNATTCPLNVCCSEYGFCGTTSDFCGNSTVSRPSCDVNSASISRVVGYYNLAAIARSCGGMSPESIPQGIYTHIYAAFGSISPGTFEVVPGSSGDEQLYQLLEALQIRDLGQQLWISIGGWDFSNSDAPTATTFSDLAAADTTQQNAFFNSLILFMNTWGFTGVDIDWEYPAADDRNGQPSDYSNYPIFLANLKKALSEYHFGLSITLPTSYWYLQHFDLVSIEPSVDWFNYMSYDLHGTWDVGSKWTGAYLNAHTNLTEIESALDLLWRNNITASKINMGVAFYGRSFTLADSSCSEPGCAYLSAGDAGDCSNTAGILFNSEIAEIISENGITPVLDTDAAVKSVTWNGDQWVSFDDQDTWKLKADFAKSECLGGVLVWSVDNDDTNQTFARGLAAALGNPLNLDPKTGLTVEVMEFSTTASLSTQGNYCKFINCGEVCPNGYTTIIRGDESSQLMLDSTECPRGNSQTQTLCCPSSTNVPTCQWRGFHNSGKCQGGCLDGEAEVGTISAGCSSGYQSACCTITESTTPWSQCQWTSSCESDNTCPSGYPTFVVGSRDGWGGRPSCDGGYNYNYCCSTSSVPDAFTNCDWYGHEVSFSYAQYCSDSCPSNSIRIAEQSVFGIYLPAYSSNCYLGNEAFCCSGAPAKLSVPRGIGPPRDSTALQFDAYLSAFLANPVCVDTWESNYGSIFYKRALNKRSTALDQKSFSSLVSYIVMLATSSYPRTDLRSIWDQRLAQFGYQGTAPNSTYLSQAVYASWDGSYVYDTPGSDPSGLVADMLCNIAHSVNGTESVQLAEEALCEIDDGSSSLTKRMIDGINMNDRSDNGDYPTVFAVLNGALSGDLSLHYLRWLSASNTRVGNRVLPQVMLEIAFWIGPTPGVAPDASLRAQYADRTHTQATDRWIVMHLHIPLDDQTFRSGLPQWYPGVTMMTVYQSQTIARPWAVTTGLTPAYRAEFRYARTVQNGRNNNGNLRDYNARTESFRCRGGRWFFGTDRTRDLINLARQLGLPGGYADTINEFGIWLHNQGVFRSSNLNRIFPGIGERNQDDTALPVGRVDARGLYNPVDGAFDSNWLPDGSPVPDSSLYNADP